MMNKHLLQAAKMNEQEGGIQKSRGQLRLRVKLERKPWKALPIGGKPVMQRIAVNIPGQPGKIIQPANHPALKWTQKHSSLASVEGIIPFCIGIQCIAQSFGKIGGSAITFSIRCIWFGIRQ